jgi:hypothetical protein
MHGETIQWIRVNGIALAWHFELMVFGGVQLLLRHGLLSRFLVLVRKKVFLFCKKSVLF